MNIRSQARSAKARLLNKDLRDAYYNACHYEDTALKYLISERRLLSLDKNKRGDYIKNLIAQYSEIRNKYREF